MKANQMEKQVSAVYQRAVEALNEAFSLIDDSDEIAQTCNEIHQKLQNELGRWETGTLMALDALEEYEEEDEE